MALCRVPSMEEIELAVKSFHPWKAPEFDSMHATFFQHFWSIIKTEVCTHIAELFMGTKDICLLNHTLPHLILKKLQPQSPVDLRSIALCNVSYKILTKLISLRLNLILHFLILETQGGFVM